MEVPIGRLGNGLKCVQATIFGSIAKTDVDWHPENGESCPCEPVFVARSGADEDDSVVLTIVVSMKGTHSILVALDGGSLSEIARVVIP